MSPFLQFGARKLKRWRLGRDRIILGVRWWDEYKKANAWKGMQSLCQLNAMKIVINEVVNIFVINKNNYKDDNNNFSNK